MIALSALPNPAADIVEAITKSASELALTAAELQKDLLVVGAIVANLQTIQTVPLVAAMNAQLGENIRELTRPLPAISPAQLLAGYRFIRPSYSSRPKASVTQGNEP